MTKEKAKEILGDRAEWELRAMEKALDIMPFLNTPEETERAEAVKTILANKNSGSDIAEARLRESAFVNGWRY